MAKRENLKLQRSTTAEQIQKRSYKSRKHGSERQLINDRQSSIYQSDRGLREPQLHGIFPEHTCSNASSLAPDSTTIALRASCYGGLGRAFVLLPLLLLLLLRQLLLLVFVLVFLATLVSHVCSFQPLDLKSGITCTVREDLTVHRFRHSGLRKTHKYPFIPVVTPLRDQPSPLAMLA